MAYSSIGNIGYALVGVVAASPEGVSSSLIYLVLYMFMTAGAFAVILSMRRGEIMVLDIKEFLACLKLNHFWPIALLFCYFL